MVATAVQAGKVKVKVTNVPRWFLLGGKGTVTITRADLVGLTVTGAVARVERMRFWRIDHPTLNGRMLTGDEANNTFLKPDDELVLQDP